MIGAAVTLPDTEETRAAALFGEAPSRVVVAVAHADVAEIFVRADAVAVPVRQLGETGGQALRIIHGEEVIDVALAALRDARERCLESIVGPG
jgi:phosphoribosylformylglycinamidine synthase